MVVNKMVSLSHNASDEGMLIIGTPIIDLTILLLHFSRMAWGTKKTQVRLGS